MSLRIEKGYGSWSREYSPEYWPHEVGLERLCKMEKDFLNKDAAIDVMNTPARESLALLHLDEADVTASNADATGGEPIFKNGRGIWRSVTSAMRALAMRSRSWCSDVRTRPSSFTSRRSIRRAHACVHENRSADRLRRHTDRHTEQSTSCPATNSQMSTHNHCIATQCII